MVTTFADRLNALFSAFPRPPGRGGKPKEWSNGQVARAAAAVYGRSVVTHQHLRLLRNGERARPSADVAAALARAFELLSRSDDLPGSASAIVAYLTLDSVGDDPEGQVAGSTLRERLSRADDDRGVHLLEHRPQATELDVGDRDAAPAQVGDLDAMIRDAMRSEGVESLAFRARGLSEASMRFVLEAIAHARQLEGLDPVDPTHEQRGGQDAQ